MTEIADQNVLHTEKEMQGIQGIHTEETTDADQEIVQLKGTEKDLDQSLKNQNKSILHPCKFVEKLDGVWNLKK
jgi:hypothetical protein